MQLVSLSGIPKDDIWQASFIHTLGHELGHKAKEPLFSVFPSKKGKFKNWVRECRADFYGMQFAQQYFLIDRTDILKGIELKITQNVPDEYLKKEHKHSHPSWSFRIKMLSEHMVFGQDVIRCIAIEAGVDDEKYITKVIAKAKLNIITKEEKNEVCSKIYKYMSCELEEILDDNIFAFDSMESIGELYYHTIISSVENASDELLDIVIKHIYCRDEFHNKSDFYLKLCE